MSGLWDDLRFRGLVAQLSDPDLERMLEREHLVAYAGFDPTADSLHLGNLVGILFLARLQRFGHQPIALAGGGTGMVGDPSGRSDERRLLSKDEIAANVDAVRPQLQRFLEFSPSAGRQAAVVANNADWLGELRLLDFLRDIGKHFGVGQMSQKEAVRSRMEGRDSGISYTEFSYMLLQAYDFLHLHDEYGCRLQVGGSDQWGNITAGVELIRRIRSSRAFGLTFPLVVRADGTKFGKTATGEQIWLDRRRTSPYGLYQFLLRSEDSVVGSYLRYFTWLSHEEISELDRATRESPGQRLAQHALAETVTEMVHGETERARAVEASKALYGGDLSDLDEEMLTEAFSEAPSSSLSRSRLDSPGLEVVEAAASVGLVPSRSAARRALSQGGLYVNNVAVSDESRRLSRDDLLVDRYIVLRRGRREHHLLSFS